MKTSKRGLERLCNEEGCVLKVYHCRPDPPNKLTAGVGHVLLPGENYALGNTITKEQCVTWLQHDVEKCERAIEQRVTVPLNQNQFDALVSLIFNIGTGAFGSSTLLRCLNAGRYRNDAAEDPVRRVVGDNAADGYNAADQFLVWKRAGADPEFLLTRRQRERALFLEPVPPEPLPVVTLFDLQQLVDVTPHRA